MAILPPLSENIIAERALLQRHKAAHARGLRRQEVVLEQSAPRGHAILPAASPKRLAVTGDAPAIAQALAAELRSRGHDVAVGMSPVGIDGVISTAGLSDALDAAATHAAALGAARSMAARASLPGAIFVVLQDTEGRFGRQGSIQSAWRGGLTGLAKTARHEWPQARVKAIDVATAGKSPAATARRIAAELCEGGDEVEIGLGDGENRLTPTLQTVMLDGAGASRAALPDDLVIVAAGGARGVTAASIVRLASVRKLRVAMLGRTPLEDWPDALAPDADAVSVRRMLAKDPASGGPKEIGRRADRIVASREVRATLERLAAAGSEGRYFAVDVANADAVARALADIRQEWGPITGLVHGAGVLADKLIKDKTDEQLHRVFAAKVQGLRTLTDALRDDPLVFVSLFSSIAGRYGNPGQSDYAMANEVLNRAAWALAAQRPGCRICAINWGPWEGGMADPAIRAQFEARGVRSIPLDDGADAFVAEALFGGDAAEVVFGGP